MLHEETELQIGALLFEGLDQIDLTGPFEVLSRLPNSTYRIYGKDTGPVRDARGLRLTPDATLADAPQLDVLHVPGGPGQEDVMDDDVVLEMGTSTGAKRACRALRMYRRADLRRRRTTQESPRDHSLGSIPSSSLLRRDPSQSTGCH